MKVILQVIPRALRWTRASCLAMGMFAVTMMLVMVLWWPLVVANIGGFDPARSWWRHLDWFLLGNFLAMLLLIMAGANARTDVPIVFVSTLGGLVIESWGTHTGLWTYFTRERPPLWIIPAWPVASLAIDRLTRGLNHLSPRRARLDILYWPIFVAFYALMLAFVRPFAGTLCTLLALALCLLITLTPTDPRMAVMTFIAGSGLGYWLERWGTTRECWTYYTRQTPPLFAVLAHGMAAVAFWRAGLLLKQMRTQWGSRARFSRTLRAEEVAAKELSGHSMLIGISHFPTINP